MTDNVCIQITPQQVVIEVVVTTVVIAINTAGPPGPPGDPAGDIDLGTFN